MNLAPVLDAMGITEEDYFSSFRELRMGDRIYGIRTLIDADGRRIREEVLDSEEQPNIETLDLWGCSTGRKVPALPCAPRKSSPSYMRRPRPTAMGTSRWRKCVTSSRKRFRSISARTCNVTNHL